MRILVCGGRQFADQAMVAKMLDSYRSDDLVIIQGGASGADDQAVIWAQLNKVRFSTYAADWSRYGKAAGPIRNQRMLDEGMPDLVIAFPGGRGTNDMVRRARNAAVEVKEVTE